MVPVSPCAASSASACSAFSFAAAACCLASSSALRSASASFLRSSSASRAFSSAVSFDSRLRASVSFVCTCCLLVRSVACDAVSVSRLFVASTRFSAASFCCVRKSATDFCCWLVIRAISWSWSKYDWGSSARKNVAVGAIEPLRYCAAA